MDRNSFVRVGALLLLLALCQGCGTLWRIPGEAGVNFISRPPGATVKIVDLETGKLHAEATTPATVAFTSSPWRKRRPHRYHCRFEMAGRVPVELPLECEITNGMHFLWTIFYPVGLVSAPIDSLCGSGSCRFPAEVKVRLHSER